MISRSNIKFLLAGLVIGFVLALVFFLPSPPQTSHPGPKMSIVMNAPAGTTNRVVIPSTSSEPFLPVRIEINSIHGTETPVERALRKARQQNYHLLYRDSPAN